MRSDDAAVRRASLRKWTILCVSAMAWLAPSAIAPGLPALYSEYAHLPDAQVLSRMVLTMPMLFIALAGPLVGVAVDRLGRRRVLIVSTLGYGIAGTAGLFLQSLIAILVSRAILGVFLAGILTSVTALIGDYYRGDERRRVAGLQSTFMSFGTVIFVVLGGLLAEFHWRLGFLLFAYAFLLLPGIVLSLYEPGERHAPVALQGDAQPLARHGRAIIALLCLLSFVCMIALFMIPSQTQFFLLEIGIPDPTRAGIAVGIFNFSAGVTSLTFPWLHRRLGTNAIFALMFGTVGLGYMMIGASETYFEVAAAMAFGGMSMGVFLPNVNLAIIARASEGTRGRALGSLTTSFYFGQFLSPFYSVPIGLAFGLAFTFIVTGAWLLAIAAMFVVLTTVGRVRRPYSGAIDETGPARPLSGSASRDSI